MRIKQSMLRFIGIALFLMMITTGTGVVTTITVDDETSANHTSIQQAVDSAKDGDTIVVYPGTYKENVYVDKELTIISLSGNPDDTIVQAANPYDHVFHVIADNVIISGFRVNDAKNGSEWKFIGGIYLNSVYNVTISDNNLSNNWIGIYLNNSSNNTLKKNKVSENGDGIRLESSSNNTLSNNNVNTNKECGILLLDSSNNNVLEGNTANSNKGSNIYLLNASNNKLSNNTANSSIFHGISIMSSSNNNTLRNNTANFNREYGIAIMVHSNNNTLSNNILLYNRRDGFLIESSNNNTLSNNIKGPEIPFVSPMLTLIILGAAFLFIRREQK